jgi:hypothetical protein
MKRCFYLLVFFAVFPWHSSLAGVLNDSRTCCALIALKGREDTKLGTWEPYFIPGLVVTQPELMGDDHPESLLKKIEETTSLKEVFEIMGTGLLYIKAKYVEWPLENGYAYQIGLGTSLDAKPLWKKRVKAKME